MKNKTIYTVIVTYNPKRWVDKCLGSLMHSSKATKVIVVDNASTDGSLQYIRANFPDVIIIENKDNLGFAKANNLGIKNAFERGADFIFLLNQDAWVEENTISHLVETCEKYEDVGIVSPIHLTGNYQSFDCRFSKYMQSTSLMSDLYCKRVQCEYEVEMVNAAAWMIPVKVLKTIGGFDTLLYKHYDEDDNYVQRIHYFNKKVYVNTLCTICHDREQRTQDDYEKLYKKWNGDFKYMLAIRNLSNINNAFNAKQTYIQCVLKLMRAIVLLRKSQIIINWKLLHKISDIQLSREQNLAGRYAWL